MAVYTIKNARREANMLKRWGKDDPNAQKDYIKQTAVGRSITSKTNPFEHLIEITHYARYLRTISYIIHTNPEEIRGAIHNSRNMSDYYRSRPYHDRDKTFKRLIAQKHQAELKAAIEILSISTDCKEITFTINLTHIN